MSNDKETYITEEGLDKLTKELYYLKNTKRKEIAERIATAKELGDLSENAEYSDAKEEQSFIEARVMEFENIIRNVKVIKKKNKNSAVQVGSTIEIVDEKGMNKKYTIVGSNEADPLAFRISNESPLGAAFIGHKLNEEVFVTTPKGKIKYTILKIS